MRVLTLVLISSLAASSAVPFAAAQNKEPVYDSKTISEWVALLKDKEDKVRLKAAFSLRQLGPEAKAAVPTLIGILKDKNVDVRREAAFALQRIGSAVKPAIPALIDALQDSDAYVRFWSITALAEFGTDARAALPALKKILKEADPLLHVDAANALWRLGEKKEAVTALIDALKNANEKWDATAGAAFVLAEIGPDAKAAVPALLKALERPGPVAPGRCGDRIMQYLAVRDSLLNALRKIDPEAAKKVGMR